MKFVTQPYRSLIHSAYPKVLIVIFKEALSKSDPCPPNNLGQKTFLIFACIPPLHLIKNVEK